MDVHTVNLIHSAEKLIRDKKTSESNRNLSDAKNPSSVDTTDFSSSLKSKYLRIQSTLGELQNDLSREQAKLGILQEGKVDRKDLINVLFGETPLFRELEGRSNMTDQELLASIEETKNSLVDQIKTLEVESENIFSVGVLKGPEVFQKSREDLANRGVSMKDISEKTVERLIKD